MKPNGSSVLQLKFTISHESVLLQHLSFSFIQIFRIFKYLSNKNKGQLNFKPVKCST